MISIIILNKKKKGNEAIKSNKHQEAIQIYDEALKCDPLNKTINSILCSNKALALMKLNKNEEALLECNKSLELNEKYVKVRFKYFKNYCSL